MASVKKKALKMNLTRMKKVAAIRQDLKEFEKRIAASGQQKTASAIAEAAAALTRLQEQHNRRQCRGSPIAASSSKPCASSYADRSDETLEDVDDGNSEDDDIEKNRKKINVSDEDDEEDLNLKSICWGNLVEGEFNIKL